MASVPRLTLIPYLQSWDGASATLTVNVVAIPDGDPRAPLTDGFPTIGPPINEAQLTLLANISFEVGQLPIEGETSATVSVPLSMPTERARVFQALEELFHPSATASLPVRSAQRTLHKFLPPSYRDAFAFVAPRTALASVDDEYKCMLRCPPKQPLPKPKPITYSWIDAIGYALRQPLVLRAAGLLHTIEVALPKADLYAEGGWLFLGLDPSSDYASSAPLPGFLRSFATRVPALEASTRRSIFTAVLFPVFPDATAAAATGGSYDEVFPEAIRFDDGFAKIVHAAQQETMLHLDKAGESPPPIQDLGIFLGWDDEDVLVALNRQIGLNPDGSEPPEAPVGTLGYRVDARLAGTSKWSSLAAVHAAHVPLGGLDLGAFDGELQSEAHPRSLGEDLWLPAYFTNWTGESLVAKSVEDRTLRGVPGAGASPYRPRGLEAVPLRYGRSYELRVRLADASGGGPALTESEFTPGERPVAPVAFRRYMPPKQPRVEKLTTSPEPLAVTLARPLLGYPEAVYADVEEALAKLMAIHERNVEHPGELQEVGLADVDAAYVEVRVLVRTPAFDTAATFDDWFELYTTVRAFPADPEATLELKGEYLDVAQISSIDAKAQEGPLGSVSGPLPLPTARDVRLELRALCREDDEYFANEAARRSIPVTIDFHQPAAKEASPFRLIDPTLAMRSVFLQPDSVAGEAQPAVVQIQNDPSELLVQRLAQAAGLGCSEETLLALPGERVVFGCAGVGHRLSPEGGSLVFTHLAELAGQWLNVVRVELDRDWTWKGAGSPALKLTRSLASLPGGAAQSEEVTTVQLIGAVNGTATEGEPERDRTVVVFIDAFKAQLEGGLPHELAVEYEVQLLLQSGASAQVSLSNTLPVMTVPRQIPQVVAAGYALSEYRADAQYSTTAKRTRMLWLELAEPLQDKRDAYFVRVLAHSPDPLLLARAEPVADPPAFARSPLDPELVRVITPGEADDLAGLATMQKLLPAQGSDRHFLVPLPPSVSGASPELFGFYTYEIRVGHDRGTRENPFWSTAQGRFGEAVVLEGVQHPAPALACDVTRLAGGVLVTAPYARPYYEGAEVLPSPPNTEIWMVLYAQVHQADGASMRNIELAVQRGTRKRELSTLGLTELTGLAAAESVSLPSGPMALATWSDAQIEALLAEYGLGEKTPVSALAIELIPEPNSPFGDPLRSELGDVRILRTSPLVAIEGVCC
jgi:hypothetical protein